MHTDWVLIKQGAEARVFKGELDGKPAVLKERFPKLYRHPDLDRRLTQQRMKEEARNLKRLKDKGFAVPLVFRVDKEASKLYMEWIEGPTIKDILCGPSLSLVNDLSARIADTLARMHDHDMIHGDLTTSNMLLRWIDTDRNNYELVIIDLGLSFVSTSAEDKAVDLYVLERAFLSTHPDRQSMFDDILSKYEQSSKHGLRIMTRFRQVQLRGRKRDMTG